jgi:hypothetical protein
LLRVRRRSDRRINGRLILCACKAPENQRQEKEE